MYAQMSGRVYARIKADSRGVILVVPLVTFGRIAEAASGVCDTEKWSLGVPDTEGGF